MIKKGKVSIICPNYNCVKFIAQTIESVLVQSYSNWEMLIIDDCSSDGSYEIALKYANLDKRILVFRNEINKGAALSRNRAIELSDGEYIAFLDSDDLWLPNKLEKQIAFMEKNNCDFSFTEYEHIDENNNSLHKIANVINHLSYKKLLFHCWPGCLTVMYNQVLIGNVFSEDIPKNNDHALFLRVLRKSKKAMGIKKVMAQYRIRSGSISRKKIPIIKYYIKVIHDFENKTYLFALFCVFTHVFIKSTIKYRKSI